MLWGESRVERAGGGYVPPPRPLCCCLGVRLCCCRLELCAGRTASLLGHLKVCYGCNEHTRQSYVQRAQCLLANTTPAMFIVTELDPYGLVRSHGSQLVQPCTSNAHFESWNALSVRTWGVRPGRSMVRSAIFVARASSESACRSHTQTALICMMLTAAAAMACGEARTSS